MHLTTVFASKNTGRRDAQLKTGGSGHLQLKTQGGPWQLPTLPKQPLEPAWLRPGARNCLLEPARPRWGARNLPLGPARRRWSARFGRQSSLGPFELARSPLGFAGAVEKGSIVQIFCRTTQTTQYNVKDACRNHILALGAERPQRRKIRIVRKSCPCLWGQCAPTP